MTVSAERELLSIGMVASRVQRTVQAIEKAADALKLPAAMKINGTIYFDRGQVEKLTAAISEGSK
jgi:hypothetical protein